MKGRFAARMAGAVLLAASGARAQTAGEEAESVTVRGTGWASPRGIGDVRVTREQIDAAPRQHTSEMLSAAPGFFVDHEDGEGLGEDVYLRGFDLEHGSGIEMRLGAIPINIPTHIHGQGYADVNFIIPEVVRSIRVLEGPYDPRQGDAAIVGSAYFDVGVAERGWQLKTTYGSFDQGRVVAIAAPRDWDDDSFAAVSLRRTSGFGARRAAEAAAAMAQWGVDLGGVDRLRLLATAHASRADLAGVVRQDDVNAGRIDLYGSYPYFAEGQGALSSRVILGARYEHASAEGARVDVAPWFMWTNFRARQNFAGDLESAQIDPRISGLGDLFETRNLESAAGMSSRFRPTPLRAGSSLEIAAEPGVSVRVGRTDQARSLLVPSTLQPWDRRVDAGLQTLDAGAYLDLDVRLWKRLRISGGPRLDFLGESIDDHLKGARRDAAAFAVGPRATIEYAAPGAVSPVVSYGEGFRSLSADRLPARGVPFSRVRSAEAGMRATAGGGRVATTLALFETWVANELVFEAQSGGLQTENASVRRGVVSSFVAKPRDWLIASAALSVTDSVFTTLAPGISHYVPNVPPILFRLDAAARGKVGKIAERAVIGRLAVGYTFLSGRHLSDSVIGPATHALSASASARRGWLEIGIEGYNLLALRYADDAERYVSNWSFRPGQNPASGATHLVAAPPATVLATVTLHLGD